MTLGRKRRSCLLLAAFACAAVGCGRLVTSPAKGSRNDAAVPADAISPDEAGNAQEASGAPTACTTDEECPAGFSCYFALNNSCPVSGSCFEDEDAGDVGCDSLTCACGCDGSVVVIYNAGCPRHGGYYSTPTSDETACFEDGNGSGVCGDFDSESSDSP
jgi:hypothetical protein